MCPTANRVVSSLKGKDLFIDLLNVWVYAVLLCSVYVVFGGFGWVVAWWVCFVCVFVL